MGNQCSVASADSIARSPYCAPHPAGHPTPGRPTELANGSGHRVRPSSEKRGPTSAWDQMQDLSEKQARWTPKPAVHQEKRGAGARACGGLVDCRP